MAATEPGRCVFCGEPIAGDEPTAGRPPMAAHVVCADAALADDAHWDAISSAAEPDDGGADEASRAAAATGRAGCLGAALLLHVPALVGVVAGVTLAWS